jgi:hypothetical protein
MSTTRVYMTTLASFSFRSGVDGITIFLEYDATSLDIIFQRFENKVLFLPSGIEMYIFTTLRPLKRRPHTFLEK